MVNALAFSMDLSITSRRALTSPSGELSTVFLAAALEWLSHVTTKVIFTNKINENHMTQPDHNTLANDAIKLLQTNGFDAMADAVAILMNQAMLIERTAYLNAQPYERTDERVTHANGFKDKLVKTRLGAIPLSIPQTRDCQFYPQSLERGQRSERALLIAIAEMYVQGVATRKVKPIVEKLCGMEVSSSQVSRAAAQLDDTLKQWRERPLDAYDYLVLDARYEKIRYDSQVIDCAVLIACGITSDGKRNILGLSISLSEAEPHWRRFLTSLAQRGLTGVKYIVSDAHEGLANARKAVFPSVPWQRCQFHLQQNAVKYIPKKAMHEAVASDIRNIFNAPSKADANQQLQRMIDTYQQSAPDLANWLETNLPQGFTVFDLPEKHRKKMRTSNMLERLNQEIKRRTKIVRIFPNTQACERLVSAILMETAEEWMTSDKRYLPEAVSN